MNVREFLIGLALTSTFPFCSSNLFGQLNSGTENRSAFQLQDNSVETPPNETDPPTRGGGMLFGFGGSSNSVLARHVFYNNSAFDINADADAIAMDKEALLEGSTASFLNYTSYVDGINGIIVDGEFSNALTVADFEFRIGNDDFPDFWPIATAPSVVFSSGGGVNGSDRVTLTWIDGTITKTWLRVKLVANGNSGLSEHDVFYFGNAIGESGNVVEDANVDLADVGLTRVNQTGFGTADIDNAYDFDRNGRVQIDDVGLARSNQSGFTALKLISPLSERALSAGLGRGVNFGNMFEAPNEGDWGLFAEALYFQRVAEAGFDYIRLPVSWTNHAATTAPYTIDEAFFQRIDFSIEQAQLNGLKVMVNVHHYDELNDDPTAEWDRALGIWEQIATRYQDEPETMVFELLNEPHGAFNATPALWNLFMIDGLAKIRQTNPTRQVFVGPVFFNSIGSLSSFVPPTGDANLAATVHYYEPFNFTHQGAEWVDPSPPLGTQWFGTPIGFADDWQNWGWSTDTAATNSGMEVTYTAGWAGIRFHGAAPVTGAEELHLTVDGAINLQIWLNDADGNQSSQVTIQTAAGVNTYTFEMSQFDNFSTVADVFVQNFSANPTATVVFQDIRLCGVNLTSKLLESEEETLRGSFRKAALWSHENGMPMQLGEFGAYNKADEPSRIRWTAAVRKASEDYNIDWSYWEFGAGFGIYDPVNDEWRTGLLQSLLPGFN